MSNVCYGCKNNLLGQEGHVEGCLLINEYYLYTDGASRGNPGPSAGGAVLYDYNNKELDCSSVYYGRSTNNQAEYRAVLQGVELCRKNNIDLNTVHLRADSLLVVNQLKGLWKVKNQELMLLYQLLKPLKFKSIEHVYRKNNKRADELANMAIDRKT